MPRRGENIRKRKDGRWEARYIAGKDENGKSVYASVYASKYQLVKQKRDEAVRLLELENITISQDISFEQLCHSWLKSIKHSIKESTYAVYLNSISNHLIPYFKNINLKELKSEDLDKFIGVKAEEFALVDEFKKENLTPEYITIDIAHGHSNAVIEMIQYIKKNLPETFIIAGNVGTPEAVRELENAGADATKVGIGPGKVCITKLKTGFGTGGWQLAAVRWCAKAATKPIIADGGIRDHGDIAKSIRFGATMVMIGSLFAGHEESPGEEKIVDGKAVKEYFGSASEFQKGERKNVEGKKIFIDSKGSIFDTLTEMEQDLQSAISYAGGTTLQAIRKVDYVLVKNSIFNGDR